MPDRPADLPGTPEDGGPTRARIHIDRGMLDALAADTPEARDLRRQLFTGDFDDQPQPLNSVPILPEDERPAPPASESAPRPPHRLNAEVVFDGVDGPPLKLPLWHEDPDEALAFVKESLRQELTRGGTPGGTVYTVGIFPRFYRRGDVSLAAERVSLVTMPHATELPG
ncbi:hypothetical protein ACIRPQ_29140 [Streptomyces sp. NPDC101213]|uniref:hypothetical protein n=1 Tax=Streptomyces sp. NPDC101213 TaxID=3366130 RepID=UPI0037F48D92